MRLRLRLSRLLLTLGPLLLLSSCDSPEGETPKTPGANTAPRTAPWFEEITASTGVRFRHQNGMSGEKYFCEMVGPGGAVFDADGDGDLDLYLVQGSTLGDRPESELTFPPTPDAPRGDRYFRNLLVESGELRFEDVTAEAGFTGIGYGMGCTVGDIDGDGDLDLYVTRFGPDRLWRNRGDGTFEDVTKNSDLGEEAWTTSAVFFDADGDLDLDLHVCTYVDFRLENHKPCYSETSAVDYCGPSSFRSLADRLYRNRGDGTFDDWSAGSRIGSEEGAGLGVVTADFDGDGRIDLYVANDGTPNRLWRNRGDGTFEDTGLLAGCAYNRDGRAEASMGVEAADFDGDGDEDIFITHLTDETNTLYRNDGLGSFVDSSAASGLGVPSRAFTGFGTATLDFDLDGDLDLFVANGAVKTLEALAAKGDPYPLHQPNQLFRNLGDGQFEEVDADELPLLSASEVSRGTIAGDLDNDGAVDLVVLNNSGVARILRGRPPTSSEWIGFDLRNPSGRAPAIGASLAITMQSGRVIHRRVRVAASYLSANDARIVIGLRSPDGTDTETPRAVRIRFLGGESRELSQPLPGRYHTFSQATGSADSPKEQGR